MNRLSYNYEEIIDNSEVRITECLLSKVASISSDLQFLLHNKEEIFNYKLLKDFDIKANELAKKLYNKYFKIFGLETPKISHIGKYNELLDGTYTKNFNTSKSVQNLHTILYYFSFYYYVKFHNWINAANELFEQREVDFLSDDNLKKYNARIDEIFKNIHKDEETGETARLIKNDDSNIDVERTIRFLFLNLYLNDDAMKDSLINIMRHAGKFGIKTPESCVSKLLFDEDALTQFINKGAVDDIFGFNISYDSVDKLKEDAGVFVNEIDGKFVLKQKDRGVLKVNHDNPHTLRTKPFLNISFALEDGDKRVTFGEMSFRQSFRGELRDIIDKTKVVNVNRKTKKKSGEKTGSITIKDKKEFWEIMMTINEINHPIYKVIQSLSILNNSLNNGFANHWTPEKIVNYLDNNIKDIVSKMINKLLFFIKKEFCHIFNISKKEFGQVDLFGLLEINDSKLLTEICWKYIWNHCDFGKEKNEKIIKKVKNDLLIALR